MVTDPLTYKPVMTQYLLLGLLKELIPKQVFAALEAHKDREAMFNKVNGTALIYKILKDVNATLFGNCRMSIAKREEAFS